MKLREVHLIHPAHEPGPAGGVSRWFSVASGYDIESLKEGVVVKRGEHVRIYPYANVADMEPILEGKPKP